MYIEFLYRVIPECPQCLGLQLLCIYYVHGTRLALKIEAQCFILPLYSMHQMKYRPYFKARNLQCVRFASLMLVVDDCSCDSIPLVCT